MRFAQPDPTKLRAFAVLGDSKAIPFDITWMVFANTLFNGGHGLVQIYFEIYLDIGHCVLNV